MEGKGWMGWDGMGEFVMGRVREGMDSVGMKGVGESMM